MGNYFKNKSIELLSLADITIGGSNPQDLQIHDEQIFDRIVSQGSLGLGESYMDGLWDCKRLDEFFYRLLLVEIDKKVSITVPLLINYLKATVCNLQNKQGALVVGKQHYDVGNGLYTKMLDKRLTYSCGYWKDAQNLDQAQEAKLDLICKKINLKPGMKVLDIGCGWGSFAGFAAERYGAHVVGVTISKEQALWAQEQYKHLPVEIRLQDYRDVQEKFDRIISIGMFEHVGQKNYRTYMQTIHNCLNDNGLFLLHTIGTNISTTYGDPWIEKYIFPNSMLPSVQQIAKATEGLFVMEDWHNFGAHYDTTLMQWHANFNNSWETIKSDYDERFYRMWNYYLLSCAALFRARRAQLWQVVLHKKGLPRGYESIRV